MYNAILWVVTTATFIISGNSNGSLSVLQISQNAFSHLKVLNDEPRPIRGTVKNSSMNPVSGASVYLYNNGGTDAIASTTTNEDGEFAFSPVNPGIYQVKTINQYGTKTNTVTVSTTDVVTDFVM